MKKSVGMIGVGLMGQGIAKNVVKHGHSLCFMVHPGNQPVDMLLADGARAFETAAAVAQNADVVIVCVTGAPEVAAVITGPDGILKGLRPGATVVDCSTSLPDTSVKVAAALNAAGADFLDAAMTRLPQHAQAGTLNLLVGGDAQVLERVRPVLQAFSENITHVGPVGAGHRMKLLHNYVSLGFMALLAEVGAHAQQAGFDPAVLIDVLDKGGGAGVALQRMSPSLLTGDSSNVPFFLGNALKDLTYYCETAAAAGARHEIADAVAATLRTVVGSGHASAYVPELVALLRKPAA